MRQSIYGRPGAVYLDMPDDIIRGEIEESEVPEVATIPEPPRTAAPMEYIEAALDLLETAKCPLVIVGKGMAWSRAEDEVRAFIERTKLPFLASPLGKGVVDDNHPLSVGAARLLYGRGAPIDVGKLLARDRDGRTRISVILLNSLGSQEEKDVFVSVLASAVHSFQPALASR